MLVEFLGKFALDVGNRDMRTGSIYRPSVESILGRVVVQGNEIHEAYGELGSRGNLKSSLYVLVP